MECSISHAGHVKDMHNWFDSLKSQIRPESIMLENLPKMLLGISPYYAWTLSYILC